MEIRRLRCVLSGNVQGVGFRWQAREEARRRGLTGYARNLHGGKVEIVAEGSAAAVEALRAFCYRGPDGAVVERVEVTEEDPTGEFADFGIR